MGKRKLGAGAILLMFLVSGFFDFLQFISLGFFGLMFGIITALAMWIIMNHSHFKPNRIEHWVTILMSLLPLMAATFPWVRFSVKCVAQDAIDSIKDAPVLETATLATATQPSAAANDNNPQSQQMAA